MTKKTVVIIVALTLLISLFSGCKDNLIERLEKVQAQVEISVKLPPGVAPAGYVPEDFVYTLTFYPVDDPAKKISEEFPYSDNLVIIRQFDPGEYTFELKATDAGDPTIVKAFGKASITIKAGQKEKLEINLTYYIYGDDKGFTAEPGGILRLSGDLTFADGQIISIPSDMKLVIDEGCTITVPAGKTLEFSGVVEALGDFTVQGNLTLDGALHAKGDLSVTGGFESKSGADVVVDNALAVGGSIDVDGHVKVGSVEPQAGSSTLTATVQPTGVFEVSTLDPQYDKVTVNGNGTLAVTEDASLKEIELAGTSSLTVGGTLKGKDGTGLNVSGTGALSAGSIVSDKLTTAGDQAITADSFTIQELAPEDGKTLTLNGDVTTEEISGKVVVYGTVIGDTISGSGELTADSVTADTLSNTGNLNITAEDIYAGEIVLNDDDTKLLTLNGNLITGKITGSGKLDAQKIVGAEDKLEIDGNPTVTGDLTLKTNTTISFKDDNSSLLVNGNVNAWGDLTLEGEGNLAAKGNITVEKKLNHGNANVGAGGEIEEGKIPLGEKPHLEVYIPMGEVLELDDIEPDWETVTVTGGGIFKVQSVTATTLYEITLEKGSTLEITGDLPLVGDAKINLSRESTLTVDDSVIVSDSDNGEVSTLTVSGEGKFDVSRALTVVTGDFTIDGAYVSVDSLSMADTKKLEIKNHGTLTITGTESSSLGSVVLAYGTTLDVSKTLTSETISGEGTITAEAIDVAAIETELGKTLTLNSPVTVTKVTGTGTATVVGTVTAGDLTIADGAILEATGLEVDTADKKLTINGGGTLKVADETNPTTLGEIVLKDSSKLEIAGTLNGVGPAGATEIKVSGGGSLTANKIEANKLSSDGDQTITADTFDVKEIAPEAGKTLTLNGNVKTENISGTGTVKVEGTVTAGTLTIADGAVLEASGLNIEVIGGKKTLTIKGGGTLKISSDIDLSDVEIVLEDDSKLEVVGTLESKRISGKGTVKAGSH